MSAHGVDLSHHQPDVDFHALKAAGISFVALKATEGAGYVDPTFADRRARAQSVGFDRVILYHFVHPLDDAESQASHFANTVQGLAANELIAIDVEATPGWDQVSPGLSATKVCHLAEWLKRYWSLTDDRILIYGSLGWLKGQFGESLDALTAWRLWVARYEVNDPGDVSPWSDWLIWQCSSRGSVAGAGAPGTVDTDVWNGGL